MTARSPGRVLLAGAAAAGLALLVAVGALGADGIGAIVGGVFVTILAAYLCTPFGARLEGGVIALVALALSLTAVDLVLRPFSMPGLLGPMHPRRLPALPALERLTPDVAITATVVGDLSRLLGESFQERRRIAVRTDRFGFRNDGVPEEIDTLVLGDSFAVGVVDQADTVTAKLAARTRRRVYSLSMPATGPWHQYVNLLVEAPRLRFARGAHVIWLLYTGNDLVDGIHDVWRHDALPWQRAAGRAWVRFEDFRARSPVRLWTARLSRLVSGAKPPPIVGRALPGGVPVLILRNAESEAGRSLADVTAHPNWPRVRTTITEMASFTRARGLGLTIVVLPTKGAVYRWWFESRAPAARDDAPSGFAQAVLGVCAEHRIGCADAQPALVRTAHARFTAATALIFFRDDTHPNDHGNDAIVEVIAAGLDGR